jgi:hypothetical protein
MDDCARTMEEPVIRPTVALIMEVDWVMMDRARSSQCYTFQILTAFIFRMLLVTFDCPSLSGPLSRSFVHFDSKQILFADRFNEKVFVVPLKVQQTTGLCIMVAFVPFALFFLLGSRPMLSVDFGLSASESEQT